MRSSRLVMIHTAFAALTACASSQNAADADVAPDGVIDAVGDSTDALVDASADLGADASGDVGGDAADAADAADGAPLVRYTETREPCANRNALRNPYFGELHLHTALSFDAYIFQNRLRPADAYRFARGEALRLAPLDAMGNGTRNVQLDRPLDFAALTDHSEFLGETSLCTTPGASGYNTLTCQTYRSGMAGFVLFGADLAQRMPSRPPLLCAAGNCSMAAGRVWAEVQSSAHAAYDRTSACRFTSMIAYEWTGSTGGANLHRNVIFRNDRVPSLPVSYYEQPTAQGLWTELRAQCSSAATGCEVLAIPHNSNLSDGRMFALEYPGAPDMASQRAQAQLRIATEPLVEIVQHKGASECVDSGLFGSADEACSFENVRLTTMPCNGTGLGSGVNCTARGDWARYALQTGMSEAARLGVNPYRLGFVGATDSHNSTPGNTGETNFPGHVATNDDEPAEQLGDSLFQFNPGGLAGIWAVENSRDALFEAMLRRETFATSGTRIVVRMFAGWNYPTDVCTNPMLPAVGYANGVAMGSDLPARGAATGGPRFIVQAMADRTPLQQIQIVKLWLDALGRPHERIVTIAGEATNGASVDPATCMTMPGRGQMSLCTVWTDDQFNAGERAVYYARVLENPTCRWSTYVCNALPAGSRPANCGDATRRTIQDRAWTSPVWYVP